VPTGLRIALPEAGVPGTNTDWVWCLEIRPRSGLALKKGITVANAPGTIDSTYRGEIMVLLHNDSERPFHIEHGHKIAQAVLSVVYKVHWEEVHNLDHTIRGDKGFGSSGIK